MLTDNARQQLASRLARAAKLHLPHLKAGAEWEPLGGLDTYSATWGVGPCVVKARRINEFEGRMLLHSLSDIHAALSASRLAPRLLSIHYDGEALFCEYERVETVGPASPHEAGFALARAHELLVNVPVRHTLAWTGFYGEYDEFKFLVPLVEDAPIRRLAGRLLPHTKRREHTSPARYIHRDLNPTNLLKAADGVRLIDWEMAHGGHAEDDVAMSLCCLADGCREGEEAAIALEFLKGYGTAAPAQWLSLDHPALRAAVALAGLRQAVAGWFSDEGETTADYWPHVRHRLATACRLLELDEEEEASAD
ncbi:MAG: hypothetical protein QOD00_1062 [Blastocatellia bacterium]|jgi:hypothetical protein|nr:hypothetical protein [Blastocatellia bacterium]